MVEQGFEPIFNDCDEKFGILSREEFEEQASDAPAVRVETQDGKEKYHAVGLTEIGESGNVIVQCYDWSQIDEDALRKIAERENLDLDEPEIQAELDELRGQTILMLRNQIPYHRVTSISFTEDMNNLFV